jgi:hypothetical protein
VSGRNSEARDARKAIAAKGDRSPAAPWRAPTRRAFVAMLGAAAAAIAAGRAHARAEPLREAEPANRSPSITRWIGHC